MESIIEFLSDNPLYAAGGAVLLLFLLVSLFKKWGKVAVLAVALNLVYGYYLHDMAEDAIDTATETAEDISDKAKAAIKPLR